MGCMDAPVSACLYVCLVGAYRLVAVRARKRGFTGRRPSESHLSPPIYEWGVHVHGELSSF